MKKVLVVLLSIMMILSLSACMGERPQNSSDSSIGQSTSISSSIEESSSIEDSSSSQVKEYEIVFKNEDGTELYRITVKEGEVVEYAGQEPSKANTAEFTYTFVGWTNGETTYLKGETLPVATKYVMYTAVYEEVKNTYTITWKAFNTTLNYVIRHEIVVEYGTEISYNGDKPYNVNYEDKAYEFVGWSTNPETPYEQAITDFTGITVTGDDTYYAIYKVGTAKYWITWNNYDGTKLIGENVEYGQIPIYSGETPTREATAEYTYTFSGWSPEVVVVTGKATYTAQFTAAKQRHAVSWYNQDGTLLYTGSYEYGVVPYNYKETPTKEETAEYTYTFVGWATEPNQTVGVLEENLPIVTQPTNYYAAFSQTIRTYTVTWKQFNTVANYFDKEIDEGVAYGTQASFDSITPYSVTTTDKIFTFKGWSTSQDTPYEQAITDFTGITVTGDTTYYAIYKVETRYYTITFKSGDTVLSTQSLEYGATPTFTGTVPNNNGNKFSAWSPYIDSVTKDVTYTALFANTNKNGLHLKLPNSIIERTLAEELIDYDPGKGQKTNAFNGTTATFFLLVEEYFNPGSEQIVNRIVEQLQSLVTSGHEPDLVLGSEWSPANCACMIAMAKNTTTVWNKLSASDREKLDFLMHLLTYASAFATNDCNDYRCSFLMVKDYNKEWNPNYRLTNVVPMLAAKEYFGSAKAVNDVLLAFNYDNAVAKCEQYGFTNAIVNLVKPGKALLENGGTAYSADGVNLGSGLGVKQPYLYKTFSLDEPNKILNSLLEHNYQGGRVVSRLKDKNGNVVAYILGDLTSPYEGMDGLYYELCGADAAGVRSSAGYSLADFNMSSVALTMLMSLGSYDVETHMSQELQNKVWVGNKDLMFKLLHGYQNYANGKPTNILNDNNYACRYDLEDFWNMVLLDKHIDYVELNKYVINYKLDSDTTVYHGSNNATFVLDSILKDGYVWFDGNKYYDGGASYTCSKTGVTTLTAVIASGLDNGAYHIKDNSGSISIASGNATASAYHYTVINSLISGKVLSVITLSSPKGLVPDYFQYMHKHLDAANPASNIFYCQNGVLYTAQGEKICNYDGSSVTLAISYDTNTTFANIYVLKGEYYEFVTTYSYTNTEGTIGRLGYFLLEANKQNDVLAEHRVDYTASYYYGYSHPLDKPIKYPQSINANVVSQNLSLTSGATANSQYGYYTANSVTYSGKFFAELTFTNGSYDLPKYFCISYKHTASANPETCLMYFNNGKFYASNSSGTTTSGTYLCDYINGLRIGIGYDTVNNTVSIYVYDTANRCWKLSNSFTSNNQEKTAVRLLYFYMPINRNTITENSIDINFAFNAYYDIDVPFK